MNIPTGGFITSGRADVSAGNGASSERADKPSRAAKIARLSAGAVPGGVSFDKAALRNGSSASGSPSLSLHAAPADRNTAATGVALGRIIDVTV